MNGMKELSKADFIRRAIEKERLLNITVDGIKPVDDVEFLINHIDSITGKGE